MSLFSFDVNRIEKLQHEFLWQGNESKKKYVFVDWKFICTPKKEGGFGLRPLREMNNALLGKWLWRIDKDSDSLWNSVILAK